MRFRFPFLANEIFNCEINSLLDKFFDAPEKKDSDEKSEQVAAAAEDEETHSTEDKVTIILPNR
jgi:hypothetical protein